MATVVRVQKGGVVPIRVSSRELRLDALNGQRVNVTGIQIPILKPDGTAQTTLNGSFIDNGIVIFYWDTSALPSGDYLAKVQFGYAFSSAVGGATKVGNRDIILRLVTAA